MSKLSRRKFIGYTALSTAALAEMTTISLSGCTKEQYQQEAHYKAIVIGSGFGGSVAALRLTEKGIPTLLLEMGKFYDTTTSNNTFSPTLPPDNRSTWLENATELPFGLNLPIGNKFVGVLDKVTYPNMDIYRNICLGGGSISNGGVLLAPNEYYFNRYISTEINYQELASKYIPLVKQMLSANQMPDDLFNSNYYKFAQVAKKHALNSGFNISHADSFYNFDIWRQEMNGTIAKSALKGELLYGNNNGIKNSLDKNYLSLALATSKLTIKTLRKVYTINYKDDLYIVTVQQLDEQGNVKQYEQYTAEYLFICAGSVGSSELMVQAKYNNYLPELNDEVGRNWGSNGNTFAIRSKLNESTGNMHSAPPTLSVYDFDNPYTPLAAMQDIFPIGIDLKSLLMVGQPYVEARGHFEMINNQVQLNWSSNAMEQGKLAMEHFINKLNTDNGGEIDTNFIKDGISTNFTYHPLGGLVLGKASDWYGRLKGYNKLYAIDGSMLPGNSAMVNPTLLITALAERNMDKILKEDF